MAVIPADLHLHTTASDGVDSPSEVVRLAAAKGLSVIAITDHDTMDGVAEAVLEGKKLSLLVIPGIELSTASGGKDIHVLGYGMDAADNRWQERLRLQGSVRERRNAAMLERLASLGIPLQLEEVEAAALAAGGSPSSLGRPHVAAALVARGAAASIRDAFDRYLGEGAPAYVSQPRITPEEGIEWIIEAGGVPVLAHPGLYGWDELAERLAAGGRLQGIEARHSDHTVEQERGYAELAERYGLLVTGGSDYHGRRGSELHHGDVGARTADAAPLLERLAASGREVR
ncbi:PHP domain-containing protein [Paenibacillus pasadenensis]|uniref:PHP domain-containing protein n=1 Tax=Paenibacillus pasadenensis TaxID=217090 RepID=UPI00203D6E06|nr:PHP domain-containing protein [Paenibacillus pasadenensis]MCM3746160.1 PHP domain-containing protein [Paenibacillus pasadenensis]